MTTLDTLNSLPIVAALAWAILHFLWQGVVIGIVVAAVLSAMKSRTPEARYLVGCAGLGACVLAFLITTVIALPGAAPVSDVATRAPIAVEPASWSMSPSVLEPFLPGVVWLWMVGSCVMVVRVGRQWIGACALQRRAGGQISDRWQTIFDELRRDLGVRSTVRLVESGVTVVPMVVGWLSPVVIVPLSAITALSEAELRSILAHELAHVRRHDFLVNCIQKFVESALFFHPVVWWLSGRIRIERELCCDDVAVRVAGNALVYARALSQLESIRAEDHELALAANGGSLMHRIKRIVGVDTTTPRSGTGWILTTVGALGLSLSTLGVGVAATAMPAVPCDEPHELVDGVLEELSETLETAVRAGAMSEVEAEQLFAMYGGKRSDWTTAHRRVAELATLLAVVRGEDGAHLVVDGQHGLVDVLLAHDPHSAVNRAEMDRLRELHNVIAAEVEAGALDAAEAESILHSLRKDLEVVSGLSLERYLHPHAGRLVELDLVDATSVLREHRDDKEYEELLAEVLETSAGSSMEPLFLALRRHHGDGHGSVQSVNEFQLDLRDGVDLVELELEGNVIIESMSGAEGAWIAAHDGDHRVLTGIELNDAFEAELVELHDVHHDGDWVQFHLEPGEALEWHGFEDGDGESVVHLEASEDGGHRALVIRGAEQDQRVLAETIRFHAAAAEHASDHAQEEILIAALAAAEAQANTDAVDAAAQEAIRSAHATAVAALAARQDELARAEAAIAVSSIPRRSATDESHVTEGLLARLPLLQSLFTSSEKEECPEAAESIRLAVGHGLREGALPTECADAAVARELEAQVDHDAAAHLAAMQHYREALQVTRDRYRADLALRSKDIEAAVAAGRLSTEMAEKARLDMMRELEQRMVEMEREIAEVEVQTQRDVLVARRLEAERAAGNAGSRAEAKAMLEHIARQLEEHLAAGTLTAEEIHERLMKIRRAIQKGDGGR